MTIQEIKSNSPLFFSRDTMKFFGDTLRSFGLRKFNGDYVLYRKPCAMVNVFGTWKLANKEHAHAWLIVSNKVSRSLSREEFDLFYTSLPQSVL